MAVSCDISDPVALSLGSVNDRPESGLRVSRFEGWIGRPRDRIDCTGGVAYLLGTGGGGLGGTDSVWYGCVVDISTVVQLKRLEGRSSPETLFCPVMAVSVEGRRGVSEAATVVQLK